MRAGVAICISGMSIAVIMGLVSSQPVQAQPAASASGNGEKPWYRGVSTARQEKARALFAEGAELHRQFLYTQAAARYREALTHWEHPDIFFNLARVLIKQEKPIDAHESLLKALQWGAQSLAPEDYERAQEYLQLLKAQIAEVEIRCDEPGAEVIVDGEVLFTGPGAVSRKILPGPHLIVASKKGHLDDSQRVEARPGEHRRITLSPVAMAGIAMADVSCVESGAEVKLDGQVLLNCPGATTQALTPGVEHEFLIGKAGRVTIPRRVKLRPGQRVALELSTTSAQEARYVTRWDVWKPWAVAGAGAMMTAVAGTLQWRASVRYRRFDNAIAECGGCLAEDNLEALHGAEQRYRLSLTLYAVGGGLIAGGLVAVFLNRPALVAESIEERHAAIRIAPLITGSTRGIAAHGFW